MIARFLLRHLLSFVLICAVLLLGRWGWAEWQAYQSSRAEIGQLAGADQRIARDASALAAASQERVASLSSASLRALSERIDAVDQETRRKQLEREGLNSIDKRTVVSTPRKLALLARAAAVAVKAPALPAVALSPVPAIGFLVDVVARDRSPALDNKPWTIPQRSFDQRVEWMVDLFGRLELRERARR